MRSASAFQSLLPLALTWALLCGSGAAAIELQCGDRIEATVEIGERHEYTFEAEEGDLVSITALNYRGTYFDVLAPGGEVVAGYTGRNDIPITETGTHTLSVYDGGLDQQRSYILEFHRVLPIGDQCPQPASPLNCGDQITGTVEVGENHYFNFDAAEGDLVSITLLNVRGSYFDIFAPSGAYRGGFTGRNDLPINETGTHTLRIYDSGLDQRRDYILEFQRVFPIEDQCPQFASPLNCGDQITGTVEVGENHYFNFDAAEGDLVSITLLNVRGSYFDIFAPSGAYRGGFTGRNDLPINETGTHTLRIYDSGLDQRRDYILEFQRVFPIEDQCPQAASPLNCGDQITGTVEVGENHYFNFDAAEGDLVSITLLNVRGSYFDIFAPSGAYRGGFTGRNDLPINETGTHTLRIYDSGLDQRRDYILEFQRVFPIEDQCPQAASPLNCGDQITGTVEVGENHYFNFDAAEGDLVSITLLNVRGSYFDIFAPSGAYRGGFTGRNDLPINETGTHTLRIYDSGLDQRRDYILEFQRVFPIEDQCPQAASPLNCGDQITGTVEVGENHYFNFDAAEGDLVSITLLNVRGSYFDIFAPSGAYRGGFTGRNDLPINETGTHTLRIYDSGLDQRRDYTLEFQPLDPSGDPVDCPATGRQIAGDCNQDGFIDISDAVCVFRVLFLGDPARFPCGDGSPIRTLSNIALLDWQGDASAVDIADGIAVLDFLFRAGPPHVDIRPGDELGCLRIPDCPGPPGPCN